MRVIPAIIIGLGLSLAVSACGSRVKLKPQPGTSLPVKPEEAAAQPTVEDMMMPSSQARPKRSDELITRSEERREDKFDIPPKG